MRLGRVILAASAVAIFLPFVLRAAQEKTVADLQARFDAETNAEHKAKKLKDLCRAQIRAERAASRAGHFEEAGLIMEKYRDNIRAALEALKKFHPDARKHSGGYRKIELENQNGLREVKDLAIAMPDVYKPPMEIVRRDMAAMEDELLQLLFPPRRPKKSPPPKEKLSLLVPSTGGLHS